MQNSGNTILITGGASGIGRGLAEAFHALGNQVVIAGRGRKSLDETTAANPGMQSVVLDVADLASVEAFAAEASGTLPHLNVLINNAGIMRLENLLEPPSDAAEKTIATNLLGPMRLTAALLPLLRRQPRATIMNVSSGLAFVPLAMTPTYCATKAGIHSYTQSLRYQLRETNIEVVELIPPYVATTLMGEHQATDSAAMPLREFIDEVMQIITKQPNATEICVERVLPLRNAAESGRTKYDEFVRHFNDTVHK